MVSIRVGLYIRGCGSVRPLQPQPVTSACRLPCVCHHSVPASTCLSFAVGASCVCSVRARLLIWKCEAWQADGPAAPKGPKKAPRAEEAPGQRPGTGEGDISTPNSSSLLSALAIILLECLQSSQCLSHTSYPEGFFSTLQDVFGRGDLESGATCEVWQGEAGGQPEAGTDPEHFATCPHVRACVCGPVRVWTRVPSYFRVRSCSCISLCARTGRVYLPGPCRLVVLP